MELYMKKSFLIVLLALMGYSFISAQPVYFMNNFDSPTVLSPVPAPNTWYPDRYPPKTFESASYLGQNRLHVFISTDDALVNRPSGYQYSFYNYQGRNFTINNGTGTSISADLYIGSDWATKHRSASIWSTGVTAGDPSTYSYPVLSFANSTGSNPTFKAWNDNAEQAWHNLSVPINYGSWYNLRIELSGGQFKYYINGSFVYAYTPTVAVVSLGDIKIEAYNFGDVSLGSMYALESYDVYWDNVGAFVQSNYNIYLSPTTSASAGTIYPNVSWGMPILPLPNGYQGVQPDWKLTNPPTPNTLYIVPDVGTVFGSCSLTIQWDNTQYDFGSLDPTGGMFDGGGRQFSSFKSTTGTTTQIIINASRLDNSNFYTLAGNYIAKLNLTPKHSGYAPVSINPSTDFRVFDGAGGFYSILTTPQNTSVKAYLGDVVSFNGLTVDQSTGDGKVDIYDLNAWSLSYWAGVTGFPDGITNYKVKYDVGPTSDNTVYGIPTMDGKIDFEDLVIFSISYGMSLNNLYPKIKPLSNEPVIVSLGTALQTGNETQIPLYIKGSVSDIRGMSLSFNGSFGKFLGASNGQLLNSYSTPVMMFSKSERNSVNVDLAIMGLDAQGLNNEGEVVILRFEGKSTLSISGAELRNSGNAHIQSTIGGNKEASLPIAFGLAQNYPNPFNPSTTISYQLPKQSQVEISVFNALGQKVTTLVNEVQEAGYYTVTLNASNLSSGVYFYNIKSGDFSLTKKMLLMK